MKAFFACSPKVGQADSLYAVRVGVGLAGRPKGWLRWSAHPLGGGVHRAHESYPAFTSGSSEVVVGFCILFL